MERNRLITIVFGCVFVIAIIGIVIAALNNEKEIKEEVFREACKKANLEITEVGTGYEVITSKAKKSISATDEIIKAEWYYYENKDDAKKAFEDVSGIVKSVGGKVEKRKAEIESSNKYVVYKKAGKVIVSVESEYDVESISAAKDFADKLGL